MGVSPGGSPSAFDQVHMMGLAHGWGSMDARALCAVDEELWTTRVRADR